MEGIKVDRWSEAERELKKEGVFKTRGRAERGVPTGYNSHHWCRGEEEEWKRGHG